MSRLITEPNSCIRSVISLRDAPAPAQRASSKLWEKTGWSRRRDRGQISLSPFLFQGTSLVSATLSSKAHHLSLRGNACVNELFFFSRGNFFPLPFPLTQETASATSSTPAFYPVSRSQAFIFTPQWSLWDAWDFFFFFFFLCFAMSLYKKKKNLSHRLNLARTFAHVQIKLLSLLTGEKMEHLS